MSHPEPATERRGLAVDQLPLLGLVLLLAVDWIGADYYVRNTTVTKLDPFVPVWAAYSWQEAVALMPWAFTGVILAAAIPLTGRMTVGDLAGRVRGPIERFFGLWVLVAVVGIVGALVAKGPYLLVAPNYLAFAMPSAFVSLTNLLLPVTLLASGVVSSRRPVLGTVLALLTTVILFATATRVFAGVVGLFMLGRFLAGARVGLLGWLASAGYGLLALPVPLICRNLSAHGLLPYAAAITESVGHSGYLQSSLLAAAQNIGFTVPLLIYTAAAPNITVNDMLISLNPMPGDSAGWEQIMMSMRVHEYIPFSMLGEFASFGPWWLLICTFFWGVILRCAINSATHAAPLVMPPLLVGQLGLSLLTMVQITQYNTRAVARVLSIIVLLALLERVIRPACRPEFWRVPGGWRTLLSREGSP